MTQNLHLMTNAELKHYLSEHRNNGEEFRLALQVLLDRRDTNAASQPYPFELADPESEVTAMLTDKIDLSTTAQPVRVVYYNLYLLINRGDSLTRETIAIDTYTFDPQLIEGDTVCIKDWKVGIAADTGLENRAFSFDTTVIDVQKTVVRHQHFSVDILLESPDREIVAQLRDALTFSNLQNFGQNNPIESSTFLELNLTSQ
ncbi:MULTISPECIES: DUF6887 family protein [unclassified Microcoleus]|uniref:DUF6887 family protein n=1 Tax=unclassified Microcoleus TaxID=2642155 RepID=UPI002FCF44AD